jgi:ribA/ribD-fused uncharacterized protein
VRRRPDTAVTHIDSFSGEHRWLSNFWYAPIVYAQHPFPTNEHAFQWAKTDVPHEKMLVMLATTPGGAKREGRRVTIRADWNDVRRSVMHDINLAKYTQHPNLAAKLLATHDAELVEGNHWGDTYWGVCQGVGENHLGHILMAIRDQLRAGGAHA